MIAEIQSTIAAEKDEIRRRYRAEIKGIFGSYARGDFHADSDLDRLVDFDAGADLFDLVGLQQFLEEEVGVQGRSGIAPFTPRGAPHLHLKRNDNHRVKNPFIVNSKNK